MSNRTFKYYSFFFILYVLGISHVHSQELYEIKGATVLIEFDYGDSIVQLQSKHLHVQLDNDNAEFLSKLKIETLINTANGFTPDLAYARKSNEIELKGRFEVDHIETNNHATLNFGFSGLLSQDNVTIPISGLAELQHVGGGGYISCMLGYSFSIGEEALRLNNIGTRHLKEMKVQVLQTILNKNIN